MATCKDCVHVEACNGILNGFDIDIEFFGEQVSVCKNFKDRSRFVELPHAKWVEDEDICGYLIYRCSNCNERFVLEEGTPLDNCYFYCPNCGAKMDEQALKERET